MFQFRILVTLLLGGLLLFSCTPISSPLDSSQSSTPPQTPVEQPLTPDVSLQAHVAANNSFGFDLLHVLQKDSDNQNIFFSPISLSLVLQMAYTGAVGETAQEMAQTLHLEDTPLVASNAASAQLQNELRAAKEVELLIGNSIWLRNGVVLSPEYLTQIQSAFSAQIEAVDFTAPESVDVINNWVADQTEGAIPDIVNSLSEDIMLYLVNAVYFKGAWERPFNPDMTHSRAFNLAPGEEFDVEMMTQDGLFLYMQDDRLAAAALPYAGNRLHMLVVLPHADMSVAELAADLDQDSWQGIASSLNETRLILRLPRFEMEYESSLNAALQELGMQRAFDAAEFSNMVEDGDLYISEVVHKAVVKVDEEGTVAAAASGVAMATSMPPEFNVDRPFLFAIYDTQTQAILFIGMVYEPQPLS